MDPIADLLVIIKNGYLAKKEQVSIPYSKFKLAVATVLESQKFVGTVAKANNRIEINLIYENHKPKLINIKRVSKLGLRVYTKSKQIKNVRGGRGTTIISTPSGLMSAAEARDKKLGGEVICVVW